MARQCVENPLEQHHNRALQDPQTIELRSFYAWVSSKSVPHVAVRHGFCAFSGHRFPPGFDFYVFPAFSGHRFPLRF